MPDAPSCPLHTMEHHEFSRRLLSPGPLIISVGLAVLLAGCAAQPIRVAKNGRVYDPKLGVFASERVVEDGEPVPRGGGAYLTGRAYTIAGRRYVPSQDPSGYTVVGMASWYGDAFHGRRTANGEIFDKRSISAAHPTLPLPSYVRVTNLKNGHSMVVRVNDRGPYHGGRVMDVSQRVAEALDFRGAGTARIKIDYIGRAPLQGSDDEKLMATLRTDGAPAQINGRPTMVADAAPVEPQPDDRPSQPSPVAVAQAADSRDEEEEPPVASAPARLAVVPLPPTRPFSFDAGRSPLLRQRRPPPRGKVAAVDESVAPFAPPRLHVGTETSTARSRQRIGFDSERAGQVRQGSLQVD